MFGLVVELNRGQPLGQQHRVICRPKGAHSLEVGLCAGLQNFGWQYFAESPRMREVPAGCIFWFPCVLWVGRSFLCVPSSWRATSIFRKTTEKPPSSPAGNCRSQAVKGVDLNGSPLLNLHPCGIASTIKRWLHYDKTKVTLREWGEQFQLL